MPLKFNKPALKNMLYPRIYSQYCLRLWIYICFTEIKFNNFHILPTPNRLVKMKNLKPFSSKIYKGQLHCTSSVSAEKDPELMVFSTYSTPWPQRTGGYSWHSEKHQFPIKPEWNYSLIMKVLQAVCIRNHY